MSETPSDETRHFTLRRGFVVFLGLVVLALYFMWAAYGAAPTSLSFLGAAPEEGAGEAAGGHGGHGGGGGGMTPEEFAELTDRFVEAFSLPDGSVKPGRMPMQGMMGMSGMSGMSGMEHMEGTQAGHGTTETGQGMAQEMTQGMAMGESDAHGMAAAGHGEPSMAGGHAEQMAEPGHGAGESQIGGMMSAGAGEGEEGHGHDADAEPIDVYLMAVQFSYVPAVLRLEHGQPYRFRMMSTDVNHGASIHTGFLGHIMRRPARTLVEMVMTFERAGEYMVYCTVYCGDGHDVMKGKIIVE